MQTGPARKLIIYVDEKDRLHHKPVYEIVVDILYEKKILGLSVFRGIGGYGSDGVLHTAKMLELSSDLPVKIEAVDSEEKIMEVLPELCEVVQKCLIELSETTVVRCPADRGAKGGKNVSEGGSSVK